MCLWFLFLALLELRGFPALGRCFSCLLVLSKLLLVFAFLPHHGPKTVQRSLGPAGALCLSCEAGPCSARWLTWGPRKRGGAPRESDGPHTVGHLPVWGALALSVTAGEEQGGGAASFGAAIGPRDTS